MLLSPTPAQAVAARAAEVGAAVVAAADLAEVP